MSRPPKCRRVAFLPEATYFKPAGIPLRYLDEVVVSVEEAEAIRLKDLEGLEQEQCAQNMSISRRTFQRVLESVRQKIAEALLHGKAIRIEGGNFEMITRRFRCVQDHEWDVPFETMITSPPGQCPVCNSPEIMPLVPETIGRHCMGQSRRQCGRQKGRSQGRGDKQVEVFE
ncbi:DUF134 domain-containing protein [Chloroflexota bacterium]